MAVMRSMNVRGRGGAVKCRAQQRQQQRRGAKEVGANRRAAVAQIAVAVAGFAALGRAQLAEAEGTDYTRQCVQLPTSCPKPKKGE